MGWIRYRKKSGKDKHLQFVLGWFLKWTCQIELINTQAQLMASEVFKKWILATNGTRFVIRFGCTAENIYLPIFWCSSVAGIPERGAGPVPLPSHRGLLSAEEHETDRCLPEA
ncbi:hypothetical protein CEXT_675761 [Caerostris extrusa]|uniref:Uncharacterized protein n=1 Tax=Caerostris extrusa TaxID=172846 RepID=A0AAV4PDL0_CAEEX|nr:hypothetical protein CEXT_675761 [Caerostris extrusa]